MNTQAMFIVFEGIDGSGKSTQIGLLRQWLPTSGLMPEGARLVVTQEPGGTPLGRVLCGHLISPEMKGTIEEWLLYEADRAYHVRTVIDPAIEAGDWVLCDRYQGSTLAYQGQTRSIHRIRDLQRLTASKHTPNITFWLDVPINMAIKRIEKRDGKFRETQETLINAARSYQAQATLNDWKKIDSSKNTLEVFEQCKEVIVKKLS